MSATVIWEGTGEELLTQASKLRHYDRLQIATLEAGDDDVFARLEKRGVTWKRGIPVFPPEQDYTPPTIEQVQAWLNDED